MPCVHAVETGQYCVQTNDQNQKPRIVHHLGAERNWTYDISRVPLVVNDPKHCNTRAKTVDSLQ